MTLLSTPLVESNLAILRNKNTSSELFRNAIKRITYFLMYEASKNLPTILTNIETPVAPAEVKVINSEYKIIIAPILRAGLIFSDITLDLLPFASVQHIGMFRDEKTLKPIWYFDKTSTKYKAPEKTLIYILDPMLATGNSAKATIELFLSKDIPQENITFISLISSPEGIKNIFEKYENIKIVTSAVDKNLNKYGYIIPGLGDAGDRIFNTIEE